MPESRIDRVSMEKTDRSFYRDLTDQKESPFYGKDLLDVFICAVALGFKNRARKSLKTKEGFILLSTIEKNDEAMWLLRVVGVQARGLDIIGNKEEILKIAEEYANGGIKDLYKIIFESESGDPLKHLESIALELLENNKSS